MDNYIQPVKKENKNDEGNEEEKEEEEEKKLKNQYSAWGIFFGILLFIVFVIIWELGLHDLPRFFNPYYEVCQNSGYQVVQKFCDIKQYEIIRLLLHFCLLVPLLMVIIVVNHTNQGKKMKSYNRILLLAYFFSILFLLTHVFVEFAYYLFRYYREIGNYVVLSVIAIAFVFLIVYLQKRFNKSK
ncbi:MAG: hypothetical protein U5L76_00580 [Patescibacteria group bacterium]|nr:hypothetical protein [Patescibacteria group bacterium]